MRVLVLEDDVDLADVVVMGLRNEAYATDHAPTLSAAKDLLLTTAYDVACIDLGLPDGDGLDLIKSLNHDATLYERPKRIIILTARDAVAQRVAGLDAGADDYLVKPFAFEELVARLRAVNRRGAQQTTTTLTFADITLNTATLVASREGQPLALTSREFAMLRYFMQHPQQVLSAEHLLEHCWDINADPFTASVRVILSRLRSKLGKPTVIHTVVGAGYKLGDPS